VVENQPGAAGLIGTEKVARAAPDGYVIGGFNDSIMTMLPNLHAKMPWDILKDFEPVSLIASIEWGLVVPPASPFRTVADVVAAAKARPGALNYSSGGNGSPQHVAMELFKSQAGIFLTHIPYRGATAAALDAASGQVDVHLSGLPTVFGMIKGGKLRLLAVGSAQRLAQFPDVPTIDESGVKGYRFNSFFAIVAPAGTPAPILKRLHDEAAKAALAPDVSERLVAQGFVVRASSPEDLAAATRAQLERYGKLFKTAGIRVD
jgi:tripartite-type tricarboxylate transporter receptor subunit TctC